MLLRFRLHLLASKADPSKGDARFLDLMHTEQPAVRRRKGALRAVSKTCEARTSPAATVQGRTAFCTEHKAERGSGMPMPDPVPPWARPNPNSWPAAVTSQADMRQFVEMMTGRRPENQIDLTHLLPGLAASYEDVSDCFLFFVPAGSKPYVDLRSPIEPLQQHWMSNTTSGLPRKAIIVGTDFYESVQISRGACACQFNFGGSSENVTKVTPSEVVPSNRCSAGMAFQQTLDGFMEANIQNMARVQKTDTPLKAWWRKANWHCLLNKYASTRNHGITFHDDDGPPTYDTTKDPVVSYSFDPPAPLFIRHRKTHKKAERVPVLLVHQRHGDALIMGGAFQKKFEHMVPSLHQWLRAQPGRDLQVPGERKQHILTALAVNGSNGFDEDRLALAHRRATDPTFHAVRCNVNVRWHRKHLDKGCPYMEREPVELPHWQADTEGLVQRRRQAWEEMARARTEPEPIRPAPTMHLVTQQVRRSDAAPSHEPLPNNTGVLKGHREVSRSRLLPRIQNHVQLRSCPQRMLQRLTPTRMLPM